MKTSKSITKGKGSINHNRRVFISKNVDESRTHLNINLIDLDIKDVYGDLFGEATKKYNEKQTHKDRIIKSYYEKILHSNQEKPFYELIIQLGNKDNSDELNRLAPQVYKDMVNVMREKYTNMVIFGAYIHLDEKTPHLHLDYIPVCHNQKRGLETRNSHSRALKEMGFKDYIHWREALNNDLDAIADSYGIEIIDMHNTDKHLNIHKYKEVMQKVDMAKGYLNSIEEQIEKKNKEKCLLDSEIVDKRISSSLADSIIQLEENYEAAEYDVFVLETHPTVDNINKINKKWGNPFPQIYDCNNFSLIKQTADDLLQWLKEIIEWLSNIFKDILGKAYEEFAYDIKNQYETKSNTLIEKDY